MEPENLTLAVLKQIRDAVTETNARLDQTNARLDQTNQRIDHLSDDLGRRIVESEMRTATALVQLATSVDGVRSLLARQLSLRGRVEQCEADIRDLKTRIS